MSGVETIALPPVLAPLLDALDALTSPDLPAVAVVGGIAVNIRLSTASNAHRATRDIDVVADAELPTAVELLAQHHPHPRKQTVVIAGVEVDVIETQPLTDDDLDGFDDGMKLFLAGHRWALDSSTPVRLVAKGRSVNVPVATAAGLVAAKSHAAGYGRPERRATKHGGDLFDLFRLVEVFDAAGAIGDALVAAPCGLAALVAGVVQREVLDEPARAMRAIGVRGVTAERLGDVFEPLFHRLAA